VTEGVQALGPTVRWLKWFGWC